MSDHSYSSPTKPETEVSLLQKLSSSKDDFSKDVDKMSTDENGLSNNNTLTNTEAVRMLMFEDNELVQKETNTKNEVKIDNKVHGDDDDEQMGDNSIDESEEKGDNSIDEPEESIDESEEKGDNSIDESGEKGDNSILESERKGDNSIEESGVTNINSEQIAGDSDTDSCVDDINDSDVEKSSSVFGVISKVYSENEKNSSIITEDLSENENDQKDKISEKCLENEETRQNDDEENMEVDVIGDINNKNVTTSPLSKDGEDGIVIDEGNMVKPADVYGPGKRSVKSALSNDFLNESALEEEIENTKRSGKPKSRHSLGTSGGTPEALFKKRVLPAHSKFHHLDLAMITEPFKHGWRREVVIRNQNSDRLDRMADIYYHPPNGKKKLRSMPQIVEFLHKTGSSLTKDNFTFFKKPISTPPFETVRNAGRATNYGFHSHKLKRKLNMSDSEDYHLDSAEFPEDDEPHVKPEIVIERDSDDVISPLAVTPPSKNIYKKGRIFGKSKSKFKIVGLKNSSHPASPVSNITMIICPKTEAEDSPEVPKTKVLTAEDVLASPLITEEFLMKGNESQSNFLENNNVDNEMDTGISFSAGIQPPAKKFKATARKSTTQKIFRSPFRNRITSESGMESLCSLSCPGQENIPPNLHCSMCLCLFHPQCVNFPVDSDQTFVCLRCLNPKAIDPKAPFRKSTAPSTLTAMLAKPPIHSTLDTSPFSEVRVKEEPKDDGEYGGASTLYPTSVTTSSISTSNSKFKFLQNPDPSKFRLVPFSSTVTSNLPNRNYTNSKADTKAETVSNLRTVVKGETLGTLRTVLDKRTVGPESPSLTTCVTVSNVATNMPDFQSINSIVPNSKFTVIPGLAARTGRSQQGPYTVLPGGMASTQLYNASMLAAPATKLVTSKTVVPPLVSNLSRLPSVVPITLPTIISHTGPLNSNMNSAQFGSPISQTVTRPPSSSMVISSAMSLLPPKLIAAPVITTNADTSSSISTMSVTPVGNQTGSDKDVKSGQLLTLPSAVTKRLNLNQPLALRINNMQVTVPASSFLHTAEGLRVFLPRNTFPVSSGETAKLSVTVTNEKMSPQGSNLQVNMNTNVSVNGGDKTEEGNIPTVVSQSTPERPQPCKVRKWKSGAINPGMCFARKLFGGFDCMLEVFKYLNVKDLARAGMVCQTWRNISLYPFLWKEVKLKGVSIPDWELFVRFLKSRSVNTLNLCGLLHIDNPNRTWHQLVAVVHDLTNITQLHFGLVPALVLHSVCPKMPWLEVLTARWISDLRFNDSNDDQIWTLPTKLDVAKFSKMTNLQELKVRGVAGLTLPWGNGSSELETLQNLKFLSLTSLKDLSFGDFGFLTRFVHLEKLELGDCKSWSSENYFQLGSLQKLTSLRLECGGEIPDIGLSEALQNMKNLENLELVMFAIADTLINALEQLENLQTFTVWPDTLNCSAATVNSNTLKAVNKMVKLKRLEWGVISNDSSSIILETGTKDQSENSVLIPFLPATFDEDEQESKDSELMTEYVFLHQIRNKLSKLLPDTKLNVFSAKMLSARDELQQFDQKLQS